MPYFKRKKTRKKNKNLLNWKERRKEKRKKEENKDTAIKSSIEKTNERGEHILNCTKSVK
jgi:uncharacterized protein (DUF2252 family)